jgi:glycosyltransferase involved in cell wall biosynthesis
VGNTNKISVVINTYNAERILEQCLDSVKDAFEIVLCDMYSDDNTVEIAKKHHCKVFYHKRMGIAEPARNYAIDQAKGEWILVLDADEIVTPELWQFLVGYSKQPKANHMACLIPRDTFVFGKRPVKERPTKRFWKAGNCYYPTGEVHQGPVTRIGNDLKVKGKNISLLHYHLSSISDFNEKTERYTDLELERFERKGKGFSLTMLIIRPLFEFIKYYFINGGILNGTHGLIFSVLKGHYKFLQWAKLYEKEFKEKNPDLFY